MTRVKNILWELWLPIVLIALWFIISAQSTNFFFPSLATIMQRFGEVWFWEGIFENLIPSLLRILAGFFLAVVVGIALGTLLGLMPKLENAIRPVLEFLRATPGVALLPIAVIFLGLGDGMKIFMIALACMWPILLNTIDGIRSVEPVLLYAAKSYRIPLCDRIRYIYMPHSAPQIFTGARLSISIAAVVELS